MITKNDLLFLSRCFDLARLANLASPNPLVGSVIVAPDGRIIGEGFHKKYGEEHAEVNAVNSVKNEDHHLLLQSTIYVSLEPCNHVGKTPACSELILRARIPRVIIATIDPFEKVAGQGIEKLRQHGVEVLVYDKNNFTTTRNYQNTEGWLFPKNYPNLNSQLTILDPFFTHISQKRPYIILKWAESADGFISKTNEQTQISNAFSKRLTHKWRSESDAIMVGTTTAKVDNPELTNRLYYGKSPMRVVLDKNLTLPNTLHLFDNSVKTVVYTESKTQNTEGWQIEYKNIKFDTDLLSNILIDLYENKIGILFVEGGQQLLQSFITKHLWDEARVFRSATTLGSGVNAPKLDNAKLSGQMQLIDNQLVIFRKD